MEGNVVLLASYNPALRSSPGTRVKSMIWDWVGKKKLIMFFGLFLSSCCWELRVHRKPTRCPACSCPKFYEASFQVWGLVVTQPKESIQKVWLFLGLRITKLSCLKVCHMFSNIRVEKWSLFYILISRVSVIVFVLFLKLFRTQLRKRVLCFGLFIPHWILNTFLVPIPVWPQKAICYIFWFLKDSYRITPKALFRLNI